MTPAARRGAWVAATAGLGLSERRACRLVRIHRSVARYKPRREAPTELLTRLRELASERRRYGYRRLAVLLRREGFVVNHKKYTGSTGTKGWRCVEGNGRSWLAQRG